MQRIVFADSWFDFFAEFNLKSFEDFLENLETKTIGINKKRNVVSFSLGTNSSKNKFFIKYFSHPHFKDMLFSWCNIGRPCSQARYEWENARLLLKSGIETYRPVCFGEKITYGIESSSFFVTEELQSQCLTDFVQQNWAGLKQPQKEKIITGLASFIRKIHNMNICLPDLYVWHIYIAEKTGNYEYAVIDLHRMSRNVTNRRMKIKNLGRLHHSMLDKYFDEELKQLLVKSYTAAEGRDNDVAKLLAQVKKYSDAVSARRKPIQY